MVDLVSLILILVEISLGMKFISAVVTLPYILFLANKGEKRSLIGILAIILIYSLQNSKFYAIFVIIFFVYIIYYFVLQYFEYRTENIVIFSAFQFLILFLIYVNQISVLTGVLNFIGMSFINYIYINKFRKKSGAYEKNKKKKESFIKIGK